MNENNQSSPNSSFEPEKMVKELKKEFVVVGKPRVRLMYTYLIVALLLGAAMAIAYVASNTDLSGTAAYPFPFDDDDDGKVPGGGGVILCAPAVDQTSTDALKKELKDLEVFAKAAKTDAERKGVTDARAQIIGKYQNVQGICNSSQQTECAPANCQTRVTGQNSSDASVGCSCGGSTTQGPVQPAPGLSCENSPAPTCGGGCGGGGTCTAKTYSPCDEWDPASGYTEEEWKQMHDEDAETGTCRKVSGKGVGNCYCVSPPPPPPVQPKSPTAACVYTYRITVEEKPGGNCPSCINLNNSWNSTVGQTNAAKQGRITRVDGAIPECTAAYPNVKIEIYGKPTPPCQAYAKKILCSTGSQGVLGGDVSGAMTALLKSSEAAKK